LLGLKPSDQIMGLPETSETMTARGRFAKRQNGRHAIVKLRRNDLAESNQPNGRRRLSPRHTGAAPGRTGAGKT
ncbi:hypothetical protein, partial [Mesorhizobium sp. M4B.F.Ca.ET.013.02.1.1]|uniref:hypothetical protein n=1 Tax=Mesorhizobium sp. M4B.F.Ca.ET.013.02.1.1 TaxID=2496755 RepID=UPI001AECAD11